MALLDEEREWAEGWYAHEAKSKEAARKVWERLRQGGFLSAKELADKSQIPLSNVLCALVLLVREGKVIERPSNGTPLYHAA